MLGEIFLDKIMYRKLEIICFFKPVCSLAESFRNDRIERGVGTCDGVA